MNTTSTRGRTFTGIVTSDKMAKTVTVEWTRRHFIPKYERYEKRKTSVKAHNPDEIDAQIGDKVTIMETRPMSKTKHFIIIKKHDETTEVKPAKETKPVKATKTRSNNVASAQKPDVSDETVAKKETAEEESVDKE